MSPRRKSLVKRDVKSKKLHCWHGMTS
jgi:hypothetical protein